MLCLNCQERQAQGSGRLLVVTSGIAYIAEAAGSDIILVGNVVTGLTGNILVTDVKILALKDLKAMNGEG